MKLYYVPISSYSQKALTGLYEKGATFDREIVNVFDPEARAAYRKVNPRGKVPSLALDNGTVLPEATIILDWVDSHVEGATRLIPADPDAARLVRLYDRQLDLYVNDPMTVIFFDGRKPPSDRSPAAVAQARATLDTSYEILEQHLSDGRAWAAGADFSLADCAAAPALSYATFVHPIDEKYKRLGSYLGRLRERPSFARVLQEAQPFFAALMAS